MEKLSIKVEHFSREIKAFKEIIFAGYLAKVIIVSFSLGNTLKLFDCRMTA